MASYNPHVEIYTIKDLVEIMTCTQTRQMSDTQRKDVESKLINDLKNQPLLEATDAFCWWSKYYSRHLPTAQEIIALIAFQTTPWTFGITSRRYH